jgi:hypothetical protein
VAGGAEHTRNFRWTWEVHVSRRKRGELKNTTKFKPERSATHLHLSYFVILSSPNKSVSVHQLIFRSTFARNELVSALFIILLLLVVVGGRNRTPPGRENLSAAGRALSGSGLHEWPFGQAS